jgi:hypothetical protein
MRFNSEAKPTPDNQEVNKQYQPLDKFVKKKFNCSRFKDLRFLQLKI